MTNIIEHRGTVENISGSHIQVRIVQTSACSTCSIKGHCNASESKEKLIDVYDQNATDFHIGQNVMVMGTTSMGMQAVILAFGVPFIVLFITLYTTMQITDNELFSALVGLSSLIPYYIILYINKGRLRKKFSFDIKPINN
jgi:sigma-E factor negative regulatory protein RseC